MKLAEINRPCSAEGLKAALQATSASWTRHAARMYLTTQAIGSVESLPRQKQVVVDKKNFIDCHYSDTWLIEWRILCLSHTSCIGLPETALCEVAAVE